jgi:hypothetical protein
MEIKGSEIEVGSQLAEEDGFLFTVVEIIEKTDVYVTVRLCSDFSSFKDHWTIKPDGTEGGIVKSFKNDELYHGI